MTNIKVPCKDCICKPICANKTYSDLLVQCSTITNHLYQMTDEPYYSGKKVFWRLLRRLEEELNPSFWKYDKQKVIDNRTYTTICNMVGEEISNAKIPIGTV
ncbi:MAG: hypothetical protein ACTSW1_07715 [Candidatus Hodarchaeales archaeon]